MPDIWTNEEQYWRDSYATRPYARGKSFDALSGGYRYGAESAQRYTGRSWSDVEPDLERGWSTYPNRGESTWEQVKDAVRDAWDRVTGNQSRSV